MHAGSRQVVIWRLSLAQVEEPAPCSRKGAGRCFSRHISDVSGQACGQMESVPCPAVRQQNLLGACQNMIVLSEEFYQEIQSHPIPADLEAAKVLSSSPAVLDLYMWLSYRCFAARGEEERVPLFGAFGLVNQLGSATYARPRKFRERLERWLDLVRMMWPECPAFIGVDGRAIIVERAYAIRPAGSNHVCA